MNFEKISRAMSVSSLKERSTCLSSCIRDECTFSCVYRAEVRRMRSRSVSLFEKLSLSLPRKTRSR